MPASQDVNVLLKQRAALCRALASIGDFRPGTLRPRYRKCGKPNCRCAREGDPGHGPKWVLTRPAGGKTRSWSIPDEAVAETQAQIAVCRRFRQLARDLIEVSERLCQQRLVEGQKPALPEKRGYSRPRSRRGLRPKPSG